jgi:glycosyltransferase involved in cell wall biosynthesis
MILASGDLWAGAEAVVYELCTGLKEYTPADVTAVFLNEGVLTDKCRKAGVSTHVIDEGRHNFISLTRQVSNLVRRTRPHIIHAHRYKENMLALFVKGFLSPLRLVSTVHGRFEDQGGFKQKLLNRMNALIMGQAFSAVVAVSHDLQNYLKQDIHIPESRIRCVINGIKTNIVSKTDIMTRDVITIGSAGRLFPVKDFPLMVEIAKELCDRVDNVRFILAGDGPEMQQLEDRIKEYSLEKRFQLLGHVSDMESFYKAIDIYLNTSKHEGMPVTILEAMSHGIPVVAPGVGGLKELITNGEDGFLIEERNSSSFSDALLRLIEDKPAARMMGIQGRERIERKYSSRKMVLNYYELYQSLL